MSHLIQPVSLIAVSMFVVHRPIFTAAIFTTISQYKYMVVVFI